MALDKQVYGGRGGEEDMEGESEKERRMVLEEVRKEGRKKGWGGGERLGKGEE